MKKLMIEMLKNTSDYRCENVDYEDLAHHDGISVYSKAGRNGVFNSPELAAMFQAAGFHSFCDYRNNRVELVIFS